LTLTEIREFLQFVTKIVTDLSRCTVSRFEGLLGLHLVLHWVGGNPPDRYRDPGSSKVRVGRTLG